MWVIVPVLCLWSVVAVFFFTQWLADEWGDAIGLVAWTTFIVVVAACAFHWLA